MLTPHDGLEPREEVGFGELIEAGCSNRKEVVLWIHTVVANISEVVLPRAVGGLSSAATIESQRSRMASITF